MSMSQQKTFPISAALISLAIGVGGTAARAEDWPQFRGPNRNAISAERGVWEKMQGDGPKLDWMCE